MTGLVRKSVLSLALFLAGAVHAEEPRARATLALVDGKSTFVSGEPILVDLDIATDGAPAPMQLVGADAFEDFVSIEPAQGVVPWRTDMETYERRNGGDVIPPTVPRTSLHVRLSIDARYRFDEPGTFTIHVVTRRAATVDSNAVTFTVERLSMDAQRRRAVDAADAFRRATSEPERHAIAARLARYGDDAATDVKLALLLGPTASATYAHYAKDGLWIASDRARIVRALEDASADPLQDPSAFAILVDVGSDLEASLAFPYDGPASAPVPGPSGIFPNGPHLALRLQLRQSFLRRISSTLAARSAASQVAAASIVFAGMTDFVPPDERARLLLADPDFARARESLIAQGDDAHPLALHVDLARHAALLEDPRMIGKLSRFLADPKVQDVDSQQRAAAIALLAKLEPASAMTAVVRESCAETPIDVQTFAHVPAAATVAAADVIDACLGRKLVEETRADAPRSVSSRLDITTMPYIARFASPALRPAVADAYASFQELRRHWAAPGAALAYLMRVDPGRYRPLLDAAIERHDPSLLFHVVRNTTPPAVGLRACLGERISSEPTPETPSFVHALRQLDVAEDRLFLERRLVLSQAAPGAPPEKAALETALQDALGRSSR